MLEQKILVTGGRARVLSPQGRIYKTSVFLSVYITVLHVDHMYEGAFPRYIGSPKPQLGRNE